ncbi:MAG: hypothetical protein JSS34_00155 [Proteobacteria bacterium]|nr:hypothetical protein [Pseudomonadota bacterium]
MKLQKMVTLSASVMICAAALPGISAADNASQCMAKQKAFEKTLHDTQALEKSLYANKINGGVRVTP